LFFEHGSSNTKLCGGKPFEGDEITAVLRRSSGLSFIFVARGSNLDFGGA
jgi:hypothetical protein